MSYMKQISLYCEEDDLEGLTEFLYDGGTNNMNTAINMAAGFMLAHKEMRDKYGDEAYGTLNEIHDKFQEEEE